MERSEQIEALSKALSVAQSQIEPPKRTETANAGKYQYSYSDLAGVWEAIRKPLAENGLAVMQFPKTFQDMVTVETLLSHESGQWVMNSLTMSLSRPDPQAVGSAITYARRYSLMALVGVAPEDDDAAAAMPQNAREAATLQKKVTGTKLALDASEPVDAGWVAETTDYARTLKTSKELEGYGKSIQSLYDSQDVALSKASLDAALNAIRALYKERLAEEQANADLKRVAEEAV